MKNKKNYKNKKNKIKNRNIGFGIFFALMIIFIISLLIFTISPPKITFYAINPPEQGSFNLKSEIPKSHKIINQGDNLIFTANVMNLANDKRIDVTLKYSIVDSNDNVLASKSETVAVETQASFVREIKAPDNAPPGKYNLKTELFYNDSNEAIGEDSFEIKKLTDNKNNLKLILIISISLVILALIVFFIIKSKKVIEKIKIRTNIKRIVKTKQKENLSDK